MEDACAREVYEESGISISNCKYFTSQSWPFPSQLMVGFVATATTTDINLVDQELEDAQWFDRMVVEKALSGQDEGLKLPPSHTIANKLITGWIKSTQ